MSEAMRATRKPGSRQILFSHLPSGTVDISGRTLPNPFTMETEIRYTGHPYAFDDAVLDSVVIPAIVRACNSHKDLLEACKFLRPLAIKHAPQGISEEYWETAFDGLEKAIRKAEEE